MNRVLSFVSAVLLSVLITGCGGSSSDVASRKVTLYSGGKAVKTWQTVGPLYTDSPNGHYCAGHYFVDVESGKVVYIVGDFTVEQ